MNKLLLVHGRQPICDLVSNFEGAPRLEPVRALDQAFERLSFHKLHRVEEAVIRFAQVEDRSDVGMAEAGGHARFSHETRPSRFIANILFVDDLEGYRAMQIDIKGLVGNAHGAATQFDR